MSKLELSDLESDSTPLILLGHSEGGRITYVKLFGDLKLGNTSLPLNAIENYLKMGHK